MPRRRVANPSLAKVANPAGRFDVLLYRLAGRLMEQLERERGLIGIRDDLLPIVEQAIVENISGRQVIPPELQALWSVYAQNRGTR